MEKETNFVENVGALTLIVLACLSVGLLIHIGYNLIKEPEPTDTIIYCYTPDGYCSTKEGIMWEENTQ